MRGPSIKIHILIRVRLDTPSIKKNNIQRHPQLSQTFESQAKSKLCWITLSGTPLKATIQEAQREE